MSSTSSGGLLERARPGAAASSRGGADAVRQRLRERLGVVHPEPAWWAWVVAGVMGLVAGLLRFPALGRPASLVFDETYYVKQAYSMILFGHEMRVLSDPEPVPEGEDDTYANDLFNAGTLDVFDRGNPDFVVHPPLGKWMIAAGMRLDPDDTFFWRLSAAVVGVLMVMTLVLVARALFGSTLLGGVAGLLLAVDGHHIVHSRTSLLDIFLAFWVLVAFAFLLADRFRSREVLARKVAEVVASGRRLDPYGPWLGWRPFRLLAGLSLGAACATKWSGLYVLAAFGILTVLWDAGARRAVGVPRWFRGMLLRDSWFAFLAMVPVALVTYVVSWTGWFLAPDSYDRQWAVENPDQATPWLPPALASLWHYHVSAYDFHRSINVVDNTHPYMANPWSWLVMGRPTSFYYQGQDDGVTGCGVDACTQAVTSVGNPVVWWGGTIAVVVCVVAWALHRDWRAGAAVLGLAASYLPWFAFQDRTIFTFYAVAFEPFLVLCLVYALGLLLGPATASPERRLWGAVGAGSVVVAAVACLVFFYPVWTAEVITTAEWRLRMWWPSWV
ncbi:dolichyl-phosphate-mannose--protein mannosyltransferase [Aquipuribacter nitratireducens]|uniref:Polyprenol-phosphate-mannose--protein mannosyltransferase n=1 Tax=Aquipuribacter nitratireducens TaxID=650104 RepID=A0ABW0GQD0_9MICO